MTTAYHIPVLLKESVDGLNIRPDGVYVDVTFGGGGHSREILLRLNEKGRLVVFDRDSDAQANKLDDPRLIFVHNNFRFLHNFLRYNNISQVDGILADLGVSSHQFDEQNRGFSFRFDAKVDMRMNTQAEFSACELLNTYTHGAIAKILREYGELNNSTRIASAIVSRREQSPISTISDLLGTVTPILAQKDQHTQLAKLFQAIRIEVNKEMLALEQLLVHSLKSLSPSGRLVVITYHSLEDRLVKNFMRTGKLDGQPEKDFYGNILTPFELISKKAIVPSSEELAINNRSRSAKLRIAEKK